ncbi:MAG: HAD-IIIC family phosphatase [Myxococcales bacterium]|nr:HAD-IIIC family phosphatase [Myxococcales bacterium]
MTTTSTSADAGGQDPQDPTGTEPDAEATGEAKPAERAAEAGSSADAEAHVDTEHPPLVVAGTFTLEPAEAALTLCCELVGLRLSVRFAPYQQVFQQLLDPTSEFARNQAGVNLVFLRYADYLRDLPRDTGEADRAAHLAKTLQELASALCAFAGRAPAPLVVVEAPAADFTPGPYAHAIDPFRAAINDQPGLTFLALDLESLGGHAAVDPEQDRLAHIPFSEPAFARLSALTMRRVHALRVAPRKVLVLDCDNTLWGGVVGEDGVEGLRLEAGHATLQRWAASLVEQGVLVALCSKNVEQDVAAAFEGRPDFPLRPEHLVAQRVNWQPKVQNLQELAEELNLGLDSFVFLDDNPVECGQVSAMLPQVLTLQVPTDNSLAGWVEHLWMFDRVKVTDEDRARTQMYRQNAERKQFEQSAGGIDAFLAGLELEVESGEPDGDEWARVSQLTQRTNQFNATTVRRSEEEIADLRSSGVRILRQRVRDRFGDYGLVGVLFLRTEGDAIEVETFLLSCRVLGRGVEHAMLREAAQHAREQGLSRLIVPFRNTAKNEPMRAFLESIDGSSRQAGDAGAEGERFVWDAEALAQLEHRPGHDPKAVVEAAKGKRQGKATSSSTPQPHAAAYGELASLLEDPNRLNARLAQASVRVRPLSGPIEPPQGPTEQALCELFCQLLGLEAVGATDDYFELGGTSLLSVPLFAAIERTWGAKLPLTTVLSARTVRALAQQIGGVARPQASSAIALRPGDAETPGLFLIHDGDGEVLLYRNLAQRIRPGMRVYGIPPLAARGLPLAHTTIERMARHYMEIIQEIQPDGPYYLGGMCAGGTLAVEVARLLEAEGHEVGGVLVLDAAAPGATERTGVVASKRWQRFTEVFRSADASPFELLSEAGAKISAAAGYETRHRIERLQEQSLFRLLSVLSARGERWPDSLPAWTVRQIYDLAAESHFPPPLRRTPVLVVRATDDVQEADIAYRHLYSEDDLGWSRVCRGPLEVVDVPGGHASMLQEPHVDALSTTVNGYLARQVRRGPEPTPSLLVIIVNYRAARLVCDCLDSLDAEVRARGNTRVSVVDNPAGENDVEVIDKHISRRGYDWCDLLPQTRNGGFAYGNNAAIRRAEQGDHPPDYYLLLNPDTVVQPGALGALIDHMESHPQVGIAGSRLLEPDGTVADSVFRFPTIASELDDGLRTGPISRLLKDYLVARPVPEGPASADWLSGASFMVRREMLRDTGLMDEAYFLYYEEVDLCFRAKQNGWGIMYVPESRVIHLEGQSTGVSDPNQRARRLPPYWHESRTRFFRKSYGPLYAAATDVAWIGGHALYRLREALLGKSPTIREHEAGDRFRHAIKSLLKADQPQSHHTTKPGS